VTLLAMVMVVLVAPWRLERALSTNSPGRDGCPVLAIKLLQEA
jgi:hypothetical protein